MYLNRVTQRSKSKLIKCGNWSSLLCMFRMYKYSRKVQIRTTSLCNSCPENHAIFCFHSSSVPHLCRMVSAFLDVAIVQDLQNCFCSSDLFPSAQSYLSGSLSSFFCIFTNRLKIKFSVLKLSICTDKTTKAFLFLKMSSMTICYGCFCSLGELKFFWFFLDESICKSTYHCSCDQNNIWVQSFSPQATPSPSSLLSMLFSSTSSKAYPFTDLSISCHLLVLFLDLHCIF